MREFAFTITYERGADHLMDVFIEHPGLYARTVSCHATEDTMWRLDEVTGPGEALADYDDCLEGIERCSSLRGMGGCEIDWTCETLAERPTSRLVYSRQSEGEGCRSVPYLAAKHLGDGALCRAEQHGHEYKWRILAADGEGSKTPRADGDSAEQSSANRSSGARRERSEGLDEANGDTVSGQSSREETVSGAAVRDIYDELEANLREGLGLEFERVSEPTEWPNDRTGPSDLPYKQREALELAVEYGYYDDPRRASVTEIAETEGIPTSTLQYRLNRAESWLAKTFVSTETGDPVVQAIGTGTTADD